MLMSSLRSYCLIYEVLLYDSAYITSLFFPPFFLPAPKQLKDRCTFAKRHGI